MAKGPKYRLRRPRGTYRFGEKRPPDLGAEERRVTLFMTDRLMDLAERLSLKAGAPSVQRYCEALLEQALQDENVRVQVEAVEAKQGPLRGLREIAEDPDYLAELNLSNANSRSIKPVVDGEPVVIDVESRSVPVLALSESPMSAAPSESALRVLRHAAIIEDDPGGFLPCLRRGEAPSPATLDELKQSLFHLEHEYRNDRFLDRRTAYALHRLSFEAQVLLTDAWPGAFDAWTIQAIRAVQESVDRVLSGQDIRYESATSSSESPS